MGGVDRLGEWCGMVRCMGGVGTLGGWCEKVKWVGWAC